MNIVKITDIVNEKEITPTYLLTELEEDDIKGLIVAFQKFVAIYTNCGEYCNVSKEMVIYLLTAFCGCKLMPKENVATAISQTEMYDGYIFDIDVDYWIDVTETLYTYNDTDTLYLSHIRKFKKTTFFQKIFNFFDDEKCADYINEYNLKTILKSY